MKNLYSIYLVLSALLTTLVCSSCTEKKIAYDPEVFQQKLAFPFNTPKVPQDVSLPDLRKRVKDLILQRQKEFKEDLFDLTYYYIKPQYLSNRGRVDPSIKYDGYWIKFENDYTFRYGIYQRELSSGIYHYSSSTQLLLMLDDDENVEPKLWTVLSNSEFINMMGHPLIVIRSAQNVEFILLSNWANDTYLEQAGTILAEAHNGMQIKMELLENRPTQ